MSENKYIQHEQTAYIFLSDGSVARLLKPTFIHKQVYFNLILNGKMKRVNRLDVLKAFTPSNG
jgi:hypothetical protein